MTTRIVNLDKKCLCGFWVRTNCHNAAKDCPELWQKAIDALQKSGRKILTETYGISVMPDAEGTELIYWAAVPYLNEEKSLLGMEPITIEEGPYIECTCENLSRLGDVYSTLYQGESLPKDSPYIIDRGKPCFELYPADWCMDAKPAFAIFVPLKKKA